MHRLIVLLAAMMLAGFATPPAERPAPAMPRTLIVLEDRGAASSPARLAAPALAHLGLKPEAHEVSDPLPGLDNRTDLAGVLIWLDDGVVADAAGFTPWVRKAEQRGLPVVLMGRTPDAEDRFGLFLALGILYARDDRAYTYDLRAVDRDSDLLDFERHFDNLFPIADIIRPLDPGKSHSILELQRRGDVTDRTHPLLITPKGGYAADGYAVWTSPDGLTTRWYVDPVGFFRLALRLADAPVPDATMLNGRRLFAMTIGPEPESADPSPTAIHLAEDEAAVYRDLPISATTSAAVWETAVWPGGEACRQQARAFLVGFGGAAAALVQSDARYRTQPFAPHLSVCDGRADVAASAINDFISVARTVPLHPIAPNQLAAIQAGFDTVRVVPLAARVWQVLDRGALQTMRIDAGEALRVDWDHSDGVVGSARVGEALYISLDAVIAAPTIALTDRPWIPPPFPVSVESRWSLSALERDTMHASMRTQGWGPGDMSWVVTPFSRWSIEMATDKGRMFRFRADADAAGLLVFSLPGVAADGGRLTLTRQPDGASW